MRPTQSTGPGRRAALVVVAGLPMAAPLGLVATLAPPALAQGPLEEPFPAVLELADLDGAIGFRIDGVDATDRSGRSVASAGDVNGDGIDDLIIGAIFADPGGRTDAGETYVVFGRDAGAGGFPAAIQLDDLDGDNGFRLDGADGLDAGDRSGFCVASAGDVNGDGVADLIIGAYFAAPGDRRRAGETYVVFGRDAAAGGFPAVIQLADLDGDTGFRMDGVEAFDRSGHSVASAGDVNGDGIDDLVIGAPFAEPGGRRDAGSTYVVFGRDTRGRFPAVLPLSSLDGAIGFRLDGIDAEDRSGFSVASAGDVNGDGIDDVVIGAPLADPGGRTNAGESYVIFGRDAVAGGFPAAIQLADLDGDTGFRLDGIDAGDNSGISVAPAGDANGDGIDDLVVGAPNGDPGGRANAGEASIVFGRDVAAGGFPANLNLSDLDGVTGFRLDGIDEGDRSGVSLASAGDANGDGIDDLIIGGFNADPGSRADAGSSYVVYGRDAASGGFPATIQLADLDGVSGFRVDGIGAADESGWSVASAGDANGDGVVDLIIGARHADPGGRTNAGESYVVFGRDLSGGCAADLDANGALTIFDFLEFQNLFDVMDPRADFDGDGAFTIFDFLAFQNAFDAGC